MLLNPLSGISYLHVVFPFKTIHVVGWKSHIVSRSQRNCANFVLVDTQFSGG